MQNQNQKSLSCCILLKSQVSWRKTLWPAISMIMTPSTELSKVGKVESKIMKNADPCKIVTVIGRKSLKLVFWNALLLQVFLGCQNQSLQIFVVLG